MLATTGYLTYRGVTAPQGPPSVHLEVQRIEPVEGGYVVVVEARNTGGTTLVVLCCCSPPYSHDDTELL